MDDFIHVGRNNTPRLAETSLTLSPDDIDVWCSYVEGDRSAADYDPESSHPVPLAHDPLGRVAEGMDALVRRATDLHGARLVTIWKADADGGVAEVLWEARPDDGPDHDGIRDADADLDAEQLQGKYAVEGEHPSYGRADWRDVVENDETSLGYWEWVENKIQLAADNPWPRCDRCGRYVEYGACPIHRLDY
jgi:hypothetical protein